MKKRPDARAGTLAPGLTTTDYEGVEKMATNELLNQPTEGQRLYAIWRTARAQWELVQHDPANLGRDLPDEIAAPLCDAEHDALLAYLTHPAANVQELALKLRVFHEEDCDQYGNADELVAVLAEDARQAAYGGIAAPVVGGSELSKALSLLTGIDNRVSELASDSLSLNQRKAMDLIVIFARLLRETLEGKPAETKGHPAFAMAAKGSIDLSRPAGDDEVSPETGEVLSK